MTICRTIELNGVKTKVSVQLTSVELRDAAQESEINDLVDILPDFSAAQKRDIALEISERLGDDDIRNERFWDIVAETINDYVHKKQTHKEQRGGLKNGSV